MGTPRTVWLGLWLVACAPFAGTDESDAGTSDAGTSDARMSDAGMSDATAGGSFCSRQSTQTTFCADFDHTGEVGIGWSTANADQGGMLSAVTETFVSAPRSFKAHTPGGDPPRATLVWRRLGTTRPSSILVEFDMRVDEAPPSEGERGIMVDIGFDQGGFGVSFDLWDTNAGLIAGRLSASGSLTAGLAQSLSKSQWTHIKIQIAGLDGSSASIRLTAPNAPNIELPNVPVSGADAALHVAFGAENYATTRGSTVYYDNITIDVQP